jgi:fermentation-respiration switch protein FrsA (DUF1100 family)
MAGEHGVRAGWLVRRLAVAVVICLTLPAVALWVVQDRFVYLRRQGPVALPAGLAGARAVEYPSTDGVTVHAWFVPRRRAAAPATTAVVFHGQVGDRSGLAGLAGDLADRGVSVLLAEYRGYGDTGGTPSEPGLVADGRAAVGWVRGQPDLAGERVAYVGHSLGTGVAAAVAVSDPPAALVLLAPFTSLPAVAWDRMPGLPYGLLMRDRFDSQGRIAQVRVPTLIVGGTADATLPGDHSRILFAAAAGPKRLVMVPGADHDLEGATAPGRSFRDEVADFLAEPPDH